MTLKKGTCYSLCKNFETGDVPQKWTSGNYAISIHNVKLILRSILLIAQCSSSESITSSSTFIIYAVAMFAVIIYSTF